MRVPGGRGRDAGGFATDEAGYVEYYYAADGKRPEGVRLFEGSNAVLLRHSFGETAFFSGNWLWELVRVGHRLAPRIFALIGRTTEWCVTSAILTSPTSVALRIANPPIGYLDLHLDSWPTTIFLGSPPFEAPLNSPNVAESVVTAFKHDLYALYGAAQARAKRFGSFD